MGPLVQREYRLFVDGALIDAADGKTFEVFSPATNEVIARAPSGMAVDADRAVKSARRAFDSGIWSGLETKSRVHMLQRLGELIDGRREELAELESAQTGIPIRHTSEAFIPGAAECLQFLPPLAFHLAGQQLPISSNYLDYTVFEPLGVVAVLVPWNAPLATSCARLASALAAGNTCVLKPSPSAPLTPLRLGELAREAGIPDGVVNIVTGSDEDLSAALIKHPLLDMISFTGSARTGEIIQHAAATGTKRVNLELGGKSPNIVFADADLDIAVPRAVRAILWMNGQNCVAGSRLLLHDDIYEEFLDRVVQECSRYVIGEPLDPRTMMGPLISRRQLRTVERYVASGHEEGARLLLGGHAPADPGLQAGNYFLPTIFTDVAPPMLIAREEIFGPVLCVSRFSSTEEAVRQANDTEFGLGAGIWTRDINVAHRVASRLRAGTVYINTYGEFHDQVPFAGYRRSGIGHESGLDALQPYVQRKNVMVRLH